jgi:hypothetical protein
VVGYNIYNIVHDILGLNGMFLTEELDSITTHTFVISSDEAVDRWAEALRRFMETTSDPFYYLFDVSGKDVYFTSYARETAKVLFSDYRKRRGYVAFVMVWVTGPHIAKLFFASLGKLDYEVQFFNTREEGLTWLREVKAASSRS